MMFPPFAAAAQAFMAQHAHPLQGPPDDVPSRVRVAMALLNALTEKTSRRVAVATEREFEWNPETRLTHAEANAQASACNLIVDYFHGRLKPDRFEKSSRGSRPRPALAVNYVIRCADCVNSDDPPGDCAFCDYLRKLVVVPGGHA